MRMKPLLALPLALVLGSCAAYNGFTTLLGTTVSPQVALVASNSFDALETAATAYLQLPACGTNAPVTCKSSAAVANIIPAVKVGRVARNQIEADLSAANGGPIPVADYNTLNAAIATLQAVDANYNIPTTAK